MHQGLSYEISRVMPEAVATGLFVSRCTIQQPDGTFDAAGAPSGTYVDVAGLVDIVCMDAPPSDARVQATEIKDLADTLAVAPRHVLLNGYYPAIIPAWRAIVDGIAYDILGAESDSQTQMTRLEMRTATQ